MSGTVLSPAEAVVLLQPNVANGLKAIKVTMLQMLSQGLLKLELRDRPGLIGVKHVPCLRIVREPSGAPYDARAVLDLVNAAQAEGGELKAVVKRASKDWGAAALRFVTELVRPALISRGLLAEKQLLFIRTYHPTPAGEAERRRLQADLAQAREIPQLLKTDPARAAAVAAAVGIAILLDDKLTSQFAPLAEAMRVRFPPGDVQSGDASFDIGGFNLGSFDTGAMGSLDAGIASFDAGFSGGGSDSGSGDGGGGGD